jgi:hypothetical protein
LKVKLEKKKIFRAVFVMEFSIYLPRMTKAVQMAHPKKHVPRVLDVGVFCPTVKDLKKSFDLWRDSLLFGQLKIFSSAFLL